MRYYGTYLHVKILGIINKTIMGAYSCWNRSFQIPNYITIHMSYNGIADAIYLAKLTDREESGTTMWWVNEIYRAWRHDRYIRASEVILKFSFRKTHPSEYNQLHYFLEQKWTGTLIRKFNKNIIRLNRTFAICDSPADWLQWIILFAHILRCICQINASSY